MNNLIYGDKAKGKAFEGF
jgi:F-box/leucine-rich repeat protein 2/20